VLQRSQHFRRLPLLRTLAPAAACLGTLLLFAVWTVTGARAQSPSFLGEVQPLADGQADIISPATGRILSPKEKPFIVGDRVKKGEPVAILEHHYNLHDASHISNSRWDVLRNVLEARWVLLEARVNRERAERQQKLGYVSGQQLQQLKADEQVAKDEYDRVNKLLAQLDEQIQKADLTRRPLLSPIDGEITLATFTQNQMINEGYVLYHIVDRKAVRVLAHVPESNFHPWPVGTIAKIRFDSLPGTVFTGKLEQTLPVVDPLSRTRDVVFRVENSGELLRFGMFGHVEVQAP
jgi:RND family efflux transporter MFP subunit